MDAELFLARFLAQAEAQDGIQLRCCGPKVVCSDLLGFYLVQEEKAMRSNP